MANKIYIEYRSIEETSVTGTGDTRRATLAVEGTQTLTLALTQDITIQAQSEFQSMSDFMPAFLTNVLSLMSNVSASGGSISTGLADFMNKLEAPFWKSTPPVKIQTQLGFFTKTNSLTDVVLPVKELVGMSILSRDPDNENKFILPGINLRNLSQFTSNSSKTSTLSRRMKLISLEIPGIVYLPVCMVESAIPTFSNEITESSNPLWATVDVSFMGVAPASTDMFEDAINSMRRNKTALDYRAKKRLAGLS